MKMSFKRTVSETLEHEIRKGEILNWKKAEKEDLEDFPGDYGACYICQASENAFFVLREEDLKEIYRETGEEGVRRAVARAVQRASGEMKRMMSVSGKEYEEIRDRLIVRAVSYEKHEKQLQGKIFRRCGDVALVLYYELGDENGTYSSTKISREQAAGWCRSDDELLDEALRNTEKKYPAVIYSSLRDLTARAGDFVPVEKTGRIDSDIFIITTEHWLNGATVMFYPDAMEKLSRMTRGAMLVCPIMEECVYVVQNEELWGETLTALWETNQKFEEGILSDMLFIYDEEVRHIVPFENIRGLN